MWIVSPHDTLVCGTSDHIDEKNEKENTSYRDLVSQIQYFNADIDMLNRSKQFDWLLYESAIEKMDFLENELLRNYPEKRKYLASFKQEINQNLDSLLKKVNQTINVAVAFAGVRNADTQAVNKYLADVAAIENDNLRKLVVNLGTVKEGGKNLTLLGLAIKLGRLPVVEKLIASQYVIKTNNIDNAPLLLALKYKQDEVLERLIAEPDMYPPSRQKQIWFKLFDKILKSAFKSGNSKILDSFLLKMKEFCDLKIVNQLISKKIEQLVSSNDSELKILKTLESLARLSNDPFSDVYKKYLLSVLNTASADKVMQILDFLYKRFPNKEMSEYFKKIGSEINKPDVFLRVFADERFAAQNSDVEYWANILSYHAKPGSYLYVLNQKDVPADLQSLMAMGKFPVVVEKDGKPTAFIILKDGALTEESVYNISSTSPQMYTLLQDYIQAHIYGEKNEYLKNTDPLLISLVAYGDLKFEKTEPEILEFLLSKISQMDDGTREILSNRLKDLGFFEKVQNMLFPRETVRRYDANSLPKIYLDAFLMLSKNGRDSLITILEAIRSGDYYGLKPQHEEIMALYQYLVSNLDFSDPINTDFGKYIFEKIRGHHYKSPSKEKPVELDVKFLSLLDDLFDKGFSLEAYTEQEFYELIKLFSYGNDDRVENNIVEKIKKNKNSSRLLLKYILSDENIHFHRKEYFLRFTKDFLSKTSLEEMRSLSLSKNVIDEFLSDYIVKDKNVDLALVQKLWSMREQEPTISEVGTFFKKALAQNDIEFCKSYLKQFNMPYAEEFTGDVNAHLELIFEKESWKDNKLTPEKGEERKIEQDKGTVDSEIDQAFSEFDKYSESSRNAPILKKSDIVLKATKTFEQLQACPDKDSYFEDLFIFACKKNWPELIDLFRKQYGYDFKISLYNKETLVENKSPALFALENRYDDLFVKLIEHDIKADKKLLLLTAITMKNAAVATYLINKMSWALWMVNSDFLNQAFEQILVPPPAWTIFDSLVPKAAEQIDAKSIEIFINSLTRDMGERLPLMMGLITQKLQMLPDKEESKKMTLELSFEQKKKTMLDGKEGMKNESPQRPLTHALDLLKKGDKKGIETEGDDSDPGVIFHPKQSDRN